MFCSAPTSKASKGFTLIEVMIAVAIVGILSMVAYPSYRDYVVRGNLVDGTNGLSTMQADMERWFQDNRTYGASGGVNPPCMSASAANTFAFSCTTTTTPPTYTLTAIGSGNTANFTYTLNEQSVRKTTSLPSGWGSTCNTTWIVKKGQSCS